MFQAFGSFFLNFISVPIYRVPVAINLSLCAEIVNNREEFGDRNEGTAYKISCFFFKLCKHIRNTTYR